MTPDGEHLPIGEERPAPMAGGLLLRREFLVGAALAAAPLAFGGRAVAHRDVSREGSWAQVAHDLSATRVAARGPSDLSIRWRRPIAGGLTGPPLVVDGRVVAASLGGEVAVFDLADGRERWRRDIGPARYGSGDSAIALGFFGGCATDGRRLVVASDRVRCLRLRDGAVLWEGDPPAPHGGDDYFWGAPVLVHDLVIAGSGAATEATATRGRIWAYRLGDGRMLWSTPLVPEAGNGGGVLSPVSVDVARGSLFAGTGAPYVTQPGPNPGTCSVVELALRDGRLVWSDQIHPADTLGFDVNSAPLLTARTITVTAKDGVWAWDRRSRSRIWRRNLTPATPAGGGPAGPVNGPEGGPLAGDRRGLFALSNDGDAGHSVAASLDPLTGAVRWRTTLGGLTFAAPALAGGLLCATTASGDLEVLRADDGRPVARVALGVPSAGAVAVGGGRLVLGVGAEPFLPGGEVICVG